METKGKNKNKKKDIKNVHREEDVSSDDDIRVVSDIKDTIVSYPVHTKMMRSESESDSEESVESTIETKKKKKSEDKKIGTKKIEIPETETKEKKPMSEGRIRALLKAQEARRTKIAETKLLNAKSQKVIEEVYAKEVEQKLQRTLIPKYERKVKKQILEKLKAKKLQELKSKYNIRSDDSESSSSSDSSSSEEEIKKPKRKAKKLEKPVRQDKPVGIIQMYKNMGF